MQHKLPDVRNGREGHVRRALGLKAPPGRAPMCKETAKNKYSCLDPNCNYKDRTFRLDTYILKLHIMLELLMLIILYQIILYQLLIFP